MDIHVYIYYIGADCSGRVWIYMYIYIYYIGADCSGRVWIYMYILYWCRLQWVCMDIHVYIILVQTAVGVYIVYMFLNER